MKWGDYLWGQICAFWGPVLTLGTVGGAWWGLLGEGLLGGGSQGRLLRWGRANWLGIGGNHLQIRQNFLDFLGDFFWGFFVWGKSEEGQEKVRKMEGCFSECKGTAFSSVGQGLSRMVGRGVMDCVFFWEG